MSKGQDVIIELPTANNMTMEILVPGVRTGAADKDGNVKEIRYTHGEGSYSANYDGEEIEESAEITNGPKSRSKDDKKREEQHLVKHLLPAFNRENSSNFKLSDKLPEEAHIADVFIEDAGTKERRVIQVTESDRKATERLRSRKSLYRRGDAYQLFSDAAKERITAKGECKYSKEDRSKTVLALDGRSWPGVTKKVLESFRSREKDILKQAGYYQIWFVCIVEDTAVRLY